MLDLKHPLTKHIFAAGGTEGAIVQQAKLITRSARRDRLRVRDGCASGLAELRRLAREHFADRPAIPPAIDELERALARLADLPGVPEEGPPAEYTCPSCGAALDRRGKYGFPAPDAPTDIYCSPCLQIVMPAACELRSWESGFGSEAI